MAEIIEIKFEGGIASTGQLHFYEFSRSQYAIARFVSTIEHFRRTGRVSERVGRSNYVDIIIKTPEKGSFLEQIVVPHLQEAASTFVSVGLNKLIAYVWTVLLPRSEKAENQILDLSKIELAKERERTKQSRQETERLKVLERIVAGERATTQQALELAGSALDQRDRAHERASLDTAALNELVRELKAEKARNDQIEDCAGELEKIPSDKILQLASRVRPMMSDIALPLRRSADRMEMGSSKQRAVLITPEILKEIEKRTTQEKEFKIDGLIKNYDRVSGVGKIIPEVFDECIRRPLNFILSVADRKRYRDAILDAMKRDKVTLVCRLNVDDNGFATSLIFVGLEYPDDDAYPLNPVAST